MRLTIAASLGSIAVLAVGLAALRSPSPLSASLAFSAAIAYLAFAALAAVFRSGPRRAFWVGNAACGWLYLALCFGPWFEQRVGPALATTAALDYLFPLVATPDALKAATGAVVVHSGGQALISGTGKPNDPGTFWLADDWPVTFNGTTEPLISTSPPRFRRVGHSLFAVLLAALGGLVARALDASRRAQAPGGPAA